MYQLILIKGWRCRISEALIAHSTMLEAQGIITNEDHAADPSEVLEQIEKEILNL